MKNICKKIIVVLGCMASGTMYAVVTEQPAWSKDASSDLVEKLLAQQQKLYNILEDYWFDDEGFFRVGDRDVKTVRFVLTPDMLGRMQQDKLISSMQAAIQRFKPDQQQLYKDQVTPYLTELADIRKQLETQRKKLDDAVAALATILGKPAKKVMTLADENLTALNSQIKDASTKIDANIALSVIKKLRPVFSIQATETVAVPTTMGTREMPTTRMAGGATGGESGAGAGAAVGVAKAVSQSFDIGSIVKFSTDINKRSLCRDRHFDIVRDSKGLHITCIAK